MTALTAWAGGIRTNWEYPESTQGRRSRTPSRRLGSGHQETATRFDAPAPRKDKLISAVRSRRIRSFHDRDNDTERTLREALQPHARGAEARGVAAVTWRGAGRFAASEGAACPRFWNVLTRPGEQRRAPMSFSLRQDHNGTAGVFILENRFCRECRCDDRPKWSVRGADRGIYAWGSPSLGLAQG